MKKGVLPLETLVKFIPHAIVLIVVFVVFVGLINTFLAKDVTPEMKDFQRILSEIDYLKEQPYLGSPQTITVPVQRDSVLSMIFYPPNSDSPPECKNNACLCLYEKGGTICKVYPDIKRDCGQCGQICQKNTQVITRQEPTRITITRDCNEIILS